ncbi:class I SAM-dependent methyltransferase [uncultured Alistipes sp.]|uniref:class I SAM-dependent methyltransferase n=1 Tax=uncultured Alistipes sp. TaxID=538949 RepID=UPI0025F78BD8|nr:class I SAM-dependent methyltransferase [uncultured Alistipes sp.]
MDESVAAAMDARQDTAIVPFLPYIFQDWWELGTPSGIVLEIIQRHFKTYSKLQVLDLGCGKGAVSVKLAETLGCKCHGIDAIPEFIAAAKEKAKEYGVEALCRFEVGDVREKIERLDIFDIFIFGATGPIFNDYFSALTALSEHLSDEGIIVIEEAYIDDTSTFQHPPLVTRKELLKQFAQAGMELVDETTGKHSDFADSAEDMENIVKRCNELKMEHPEKSSLFENYVRNQASEYDVLENKVGGSILVLKRVKIG